MKLAATILSLASIVAAQDSSSSVTLTPLQQCLQKTCPNNVNDVNCQAACLGLPNPNASMIADTAACYAKCPATDNQQAQIDCKNKCDQIYNPSGSIISDHLTPVGVSPVSSPTSTTKTDTTKPTASPQSSPAASPSSSGTVPPKSDTPKASNSDSDSNSDSNSNSDSSSKKNGAATLKAAFSAVVIVAAAALF
ncbi:hypothetical protein GGI24_000037 [Coemansia furcata]|nr:hypothetical protein GGI24_000037 [Coemansia furcata]